MILFEPTGNERSLKTMFATLDLVWSPDSSASNSTATVILKVSQISHVAEKI